MTDLTGKTISNRYRVDSLLGRGGMGDVYKVWDTQRGVFLAMKVLHADLAEDKVFLRRFEREAETLATLQHPHIVRFYGLEQQGRLTFILMEYVEGTTLRGLIFDNHKPFSAEQVLQIVRPICSALHYAHQMGRVHCDIKPANIMMKSPSEVLLADFGIARMMESSTTMTMAGAGTPAYMAPEQVLGKNPIPQTDIYALGIILYEMLTGGERPFTGEQAQVDGSTAEKVRWEQVTLKPPSPRKYNPNISPQLEAVVLKCLEKKPEHRYADVFIFLNALSAAVKGRLHEPQVPVISRPPRKVEAVERSAVKELKPSAPRKANFPLFAWMIGSFLIIALVLFLGGIKGRPVPVATESPAPATEAPVITTEAPVISVKTMISDKDNATLVYVPEGDFTMGSDNSDKSDEKPQHFITLKAFWIDQTEVTNEMYAKCVDAGKCDTPGDDTGYFSNSDYVKHPVIWVNWNQANTYCSWVERRLPTEAEWEKAARGTDARNYPWGEGLDCNKANYYGCKNYTTPVGSYESGKSPYGAYDMAGNAWEWVSSLYKPYPYEPSDGREDMNSLDARVLRGGSWYYDDFDVRSALRIWLYPSDAFEYYVGFRCARSSVVTELPATKDPAVSIIVTDAASTAIAEFTLTAAAFTPTPMDVATEAPVATETPVLGIGSTMIGEDGATLVYVPEGNFTMGSSVNDENDASHVLEECQKFKSDCTQDWFTDQKPPHSVHLDAYWIDETEVTIAMYKQCVSAGSCQEPKDKTSYTGGRYYGNPEFDNYPVINVTWDMAKTYCEWAERRLPTESEWEKAARGIDGRIYPWGNTLDDTRLNFCDVNCLKDWAIKSYNDGYPNISPVKNYPNGRSPYGAYDMSGNVSEWVSDWYSETYYKISPDKNPQGPDSGKERSRRGGAWFDTYKVRSVFRGYYDPKDTKNDMGFRCARSLP